MKVSVIVPTYNEQKDIGECLESLSRQTFKNMEIIVVDDGSTDDTLQIIRKYQLPNSNYQILRQKHKGAGAARNLGASKARGEILVFVDADMIFEKDFVGRLVEPIIDGETIGTISSQELLANKDKIWAVAWNINRGLPRDRMIMDGVGPELKVFRAILKSEFDRVGEFDEERGYNDDWTLSEKLGIAATAVTAKYYHKNPDSLREVFIQSRWMGKREYKLGVVGYLAALGRASFPVSVIVGLVGSLIHLMPAFIVFKIVSDFGEFVGILEYWILGKSAK